MPAVHNFGVSLENQLCKTEKISNYCGLTSTLKLAHVKFLITLGLAVVKQNKKGPPGLRFLQLNAGE